MLVAASLDLETRLVTELTVARPDLELAYAVRPSEGRSFRPIILDKYTIIIPLHH